jgi:hypothetical protein
MMRQESNIADVRNGKFAEQMAEALRQMVEAKRQLEEKAKCSPAKT